MQRDTSRWRVKEGYDYLERLPPEGLAWEFLRRNANYQSDYKVGRSERRSRDAADIAQRWGLQFLADPSQSILDKPVSWSSKADPAVLVLMRTPDLFEPQMPLDIPVALTQKSAGSLNAVSIIGDHTIQYCFRGKSETW